jgi:diguanylate cyclase (GGDEF)-like protein/PAS domain S-box-containing protein
MAQSLHETPAGLIGHSIDEFFPAEDAARWAETNRAVLELDHAISESEVMPRPDGDRTFLDTRFPVQDALGRPLGVAGIATDVSAVIELETEIGEKAEMMDLTCEAILLRDSSGLVSYWNRGCELLYGWPKAEAIGSQIDVLLKTEFPSSRDDYSKSLKERKAWTGDLRQRRRDGSDVIVRSHQTLRIKGADKPEVVMEINHDISAEREVELTAGRLAAIVESTEDALISMDTNGVISTWNPGAEHLYGWSSSEAIGKTEDELITPKDEIDSRRVMREGVVKDGEVEVFSGEDRAQPDSSIDVMVSYSPIKGGDGEVIGIARGARDITETKIAEQQMRFLAEHDPLTGLPNRRRLTPEIEAALRRSGADGTPGVLLLGDLDRLKSINDEFGHDVGDDYLRGVASVLRASLRETDLLVRLGGDEFAMLLHGATAEDARRVARSLCEAVDSYSVIRGTRKVHATMSIGIAPFSAPGITRSDEALSAADAAMYEAKQAGRNRFSMAGPDIQGSHLRTLLQWTRRIKSAIDENRLLLFTQPIIAIGDSKVVRNELLVRILENGELLVPGAFVPVAERYGLITRIDRWVLEQAIDLIASGREDLGVIEVNLSGVSFATDEVVDVLRNSLAESDIDPRRLSIEITETAAISNLPGASASLQKLRDLGCEIGIDDFGSGPGSFTYLRNLPIDYLKLDTAITQGIADSESDRVIARGITDVAHGLGQWVVAEHIDSAAKLEACREIGVDFAQGFLLGRPRPLNGQAVHPEASSNGKPHEGTDRPPPASSSRGL